MPTSRGGDNSIQRWGLEASHSEREAAAAALQGFLDARATGNNAKLCRYVSPKLIADLAAQLGGAVSGKPTCRKLLRFAVNPNADRSVLRAEARGNEVLSFRLDEEQQGFIIYRDRDGEIWAFPMNRDSGGEWKVSLLGPHPIT